MISWPDVSAGEACLVPAGLREDSFAGRVEAGLAAVCGAAR